MLWGAFNAHIDLAAERREVDWFGKLSKASRFVSASA
jgi:hypothetical protein